METAPMNMKAVEMNDFSSIVQVETHKKLRPLDLTPVFSQISCFHYIFCLIGHPFIIPIGLVPADYESGFWFVIRDSETYEN